MRFIKVEPSQYTLMKKKFNILENVKKKMVQHLSYLRFNKSIK